VSPTNGLVPARLARLRLTADPVREPNAPGEADLYAHRALELSPHDPECWAARAKVLEQAGRLAGALEAMNRGSEQQPGDASFWNDKGLLLLKIGSTNEALQAFSRAIDLASGWTNSARRTLAQALLNRGNLFKRLNRSAEAQADFLQAKGLLPRAPDTEPNLPR